MPLIALIPIEAGTLPGRADFSRQSHAELPRPILCNANPHAIEWRFLVIPFQLQGMVQVLLVCNPTHMYGCVSVGFVVLLSKALPHQVLSNQAQPQTAWQLHTGRDVALTVLNVIPETPDTTPPFELEILFCLSRTLRVKFALCT